MSKTISVDVDGVLANFTKAFAAKLAEVGCPTPEGFEPTDWDFGGSGATPAQIDAAWRLVVQTENFWVQSDYYRDNCNALARIPYSAMDVYYVTSRVPTAGYTVKIQTENWLLDRVQIDSGGVVVKPRGVTKREIYRALGIDFSIDDYDQNVREAQGLAGHEAYLLDRPWNQHATDLPRVKTLAEFLEIVKNGR